jgi:hypothetical protein
MKVERLNARRFWGKHSLRQTQEQRKMVRWAKGYHARAAISAELLHYHLESQFFCRRRRDVQERMGWFR